MGTHSTPRKTPVRAWLKSQTAALMVIMLGVLILTIPPILMGVNMNGNASTAKEHADASLALRKKERERILQRAREYNLRLAQDGQPVMGESVDPWNGDTASLSEQDTDYNTQLAKPRDGIIASINYPKLGISLPIRHGTGKHVLDSGAGHMYGTSLPVGGTNTHTVISAHTGLADQIMFDPLQVGRGARKGDLFTISVLDKTLTYKVVSITTVEPDDFSGLEIQSGKDLATLLTCTPYGINTKRLLVTGQRVTNVEQAGKNDDTHNPNRPWLTAWIMLPWLAIITLVLHAKGIIPPARRTRGRNTMKRKEEHGKHLA